MKKKIITGILVMALPASLLSGCGKQDLPVGEYAFEDVVYVGGISSASLDYMVETKSGTEYSIQDDSLRISGHGDVTYSHITYEREELTDRFIEKNYGAVNFYPLDDFFDPYTHRYRFGLFDENGEQIHYYIFLMDDDVFISQFARADMLIVSIDKIVKKID